MKKRIIPSLTIIIAQPMTVDARAPTAAPLELICCWVVFINLKSSVSHQKSFGVPSQESGTRKAVMITIQAQELSSNPKSWKMFWKKEPQRTMTTQPEPNKVMEMQAETRCLVPTPAAFSAMTM